MFLEAYVQEVLIDPSLYEFPEEETDLKSSPPEPPEGYLLVTKAIKEDELKNAPYNSVIARVISGDAANQEILAYPLMQNHIMLPVKAGEHIWVVQISGRFFWLTRRNYNQQLDDVARTVAGRFKQDGAEQSTAENAKAAEGTGDGNVLPKDTHAPLQTVFPEEDEYKNFLEERQKHIIRPVPRYKKRPGDLVLQGSDNTLISLGTGSGFKKEDVVNLDTPSLSTTPDAEKDAGRIDIVTGRGRYLPKKPTDKNAIGDAPERTSCATILSEYGNLEVDKNPTINKIEEKNLAEGDPDYGFDASRILITTHGEIDASFSLAESYPPIPAVTAGDTGSIPDDSEGAGIVLKTDHVRLVARNHIFSDHFSNADGEDVNGSIRLVKEGIRDGSGHSATDGTGASIVSLESDGTVMIDGATIVIGTGRETSNGAGDHIFLGAGATEPIVLGNEMKTLLDDFFTKLQTFLSTKFDTHIHPTGVGPSGPPTVVGDDAGTGAAKSALTNTLSKVGMTR